MPNKDVINLGELAGQLNFTAKPASANQKTALQKIRGLLQPLNHFCKTELFYMYF